jgi:hypothetical protein
MARLWSLAAILLVLGAFAEAAAANKASQPDLGDPASMAGLIGSYDAMSETRLAVAVGNVIGHMAAMFRLHPDRIDAWVAPIKKKRMEALAVIALGLAGRQDKGVEFARLRKVDPAMVMTIYSSPGGDTFPAPQAQWRNLAVADLLKEFGTLETMPQTFGWHQDVLWSAAITWRDGTIALRILVRMDEVFEKLDLQPGALPLDSNNEAATRKWFHALVQRKGLAAAQEDALQVLYVLAGAWSFGSNLRLPFVASAYERYARDHPKSKAVAHIMAGPASRK